MKPILEVQSVGKRYMIHHSREKYLSFRDRLANILSFNPEETEDFWALKDVSFSVKEGESVGIIGRNGAGKSTLLKVLSRITPPTNGRVVLRGRVASLLEVGTGFHQELTGRENIFMNGSILGMRRQEIMSRFDEIVDFSGVSKFLDTPLKHYSSGMQLRLAFAVAAHLDPEILIIDEVLAVGDAEFQKKCMGKMEEVSRESGRTILFVSHNLQAVASLTTQCVWLESGRINATGPTSGIIHEYLASGSSREYSYSARPDIDKPHLSGISVVTSHSNNIHWHGEPFKVVVEVKTNAAVRDACLSFQIQDDNLRSIVHCWVFSSDQPFADRPGLYKLSCVIPNLRLYMGNYSLKVYFTDSGGKVFDIVENVCPFEVSMVNKYRQIEWQNEACAYLEDNHWKIEAI